MITNLMKIIKSKASSNVEKKETKPLKQKKLAKSNQ